MRPTLAVEDRVKSSRVPNVAPTGMPGALVLGGDYQSLGIVRSLGRQQIPVCVVDDENSIARLSRYTTRAVSVKSLREEEEIVETTLAVGRPFGLEGWTLFPTRDAMVAALARHRSRLATFFHLPTPNWEAIRWVWDKRNTYRLATDLGIPTPHTIYPTELGDLDQIRTEPPWVIKPAIKEHFSYSTKAKAWRANNRGELREAFI